MTDLAAILARLDAIDAKLAAVTVPATTAIPRIAYTRKEFAKMVGISEGTLLKETYWRRYGGKKIGGRIQFSEAARLAILEGRK